MCLRTVILKFHASRGHVQKRAHTCIRNCPNIEHIGKLALLWRVYVVTYLVHVHVVETRTVAILHSYVR